MRDPVNHEVVKDVCKLNRNELIRKIIYLSSLFFDVMFVVFLIIVVATSKKEFAFGSLISFIFAIVLIKISTRIPIELIYELYANCIRVIKKYEYHQKIVVDTTINSCYGKLIFQQLSDAKTIKKSTDVLLLNKYSNRKVLSFIIYGKGVRYYISPNEEFFKRLEEGRNDISR